MRTLAVLKISLVLAVGLVVLGKAPGAWACSCAGYRDPDVARRAYFEQAALVFTGSVLAKTEPPRPTGTGPIPGSVPIQWSFDVESEKGNATDPEIVTAESSGSSCGMAFEVGSRYQVFAYLGDGGYETGICSGTHLLTGAPPFSDELPESGWGWGLPVAVGAGLLVAIAVRLWIQRAARSS